MAMNAMEPPGSVRALRTLTLVLAIIATAAGGVLLCMLGALSSRSAGGGSLAGLVVLLLIVGVVMAWIDFALASAVLNSGSRGAWIALIVLAGLGLAGALVNLGTGSYLNAVLSGVMNAIVLAMLLNTDTREYVEVMNAPPPPITSGSGGGLFPPAPGGAQPPADE